MHDRKCHRSQVSLMTQGYSLSLLSVCRQIYHEAVLIAFGKKTFIYSYSFPGFLRLLVPAQAKAIAHLICVKLSSRLGFLDMPTKTQLQRLQGLKSLQYKLHTPGTLSKSDEHFQAAKLKELSLERLKEVHIDIMRYVHPWEEATAKDPKEVSECNKWVKRVEEMILN